MEYTHVGRFVSDSDKIEEITSENDVKTVEFSSKNATPSRQEKKKARVKLQKKIDSYVARNYWELKDFLTTYKSNPWDSRTELRRKLRKITSPYSRTRSCTKTVQYISVEHGQSADLESVKKRIEDEYNIVVASVQMEKVTESITKFYTKWQTEIN